MRFKLFLEQAKYPTYEDIGREEFIDWIKSNAPHYLQHLVSGQAKPIWRGMYFNDNGYAIGDGAKFKRQAANTDNFVNLLVSHSPRWMQYPPRQHAYICTTDIGYAYYYGDDPYLVIPADTAAIGICKENDFWNSFGEEAERVFNGVEGMNGFIFEVIKKIYPDITRKDISDDYAALKENMQSITMDMLRKLDVDDFHELSRVMMRRALEYVKTFSKAHNLFDVFEEILDPGAAGFTETDGQDFRSNKKQEVWIGGPCAFIHSAILDAATDRAAIEWIADNAI